MNETFNKKIQSLKDLSKILEDKERNKCQWNTSEQAEEKVYEHKEFMLFKITQCKKNKEKWKCMKKAHEAYAKHNWVKILHFVLEEQLKKDIVNTVNKIAAKDFKNLGKDTDIYVWEAQ